MGTEIYIQAIPLSLFTTVTNWKQPKCPSVGDWVNKIETTPQWHMQPLKIEELLMIGKTTHVDMKWGQIRLCCHIEYDHTMHRIEKQTGRKYMRIFPVVASGREIGGDFYFHLNFLCFFCLFWSCIERGYTVYHLGLAVFTQDYVTTIHVWFCMVVSFFAAV